MIYLRLIIGLSSAEQAAKLVAKKGNSIKRLSYPEKS